jgi:hypothetical protein
MEMSVYWKSSLQLSAVSFQLASRLDIRRFPESGWLTADGFSQC